LILKYVSKYVLKFSDSFAQDWLNDDASTYAVCRKILFDYHPLEPEMWLQMAAQWFPQGFSDGTTIPILAPYPGMETKPSFVERYEDCTWKGRMTLLEYLRKSNDEGEIIQWVRKKYNNINHPQETLEQFARRCPMRGEKSIAADTVWRFNDRYFAQWLALHRPFKQLEDFQDNDITERVPQRYHGLAMALLHAPEHWRSDENIREEMETEACNNAHIKTVIAMVQAKSKMIDDYLAGRLNKDEEEVANDDGKDNKKKDKKCTLDPVQERLEECTHATHIH
jgi:hypothetical protein